MGPEKIRFKREVNGRGVCKELMNHEDVLLKLETKIINNGKGHARASRHLPIVLVKVAYYAEGGVRGVRIPQYRTR